MCVVGVCCLFFWKLTNSTVVDRELTPWFLWSVDSGSYNGVLLESVNVTVIVWIVFSLWKGRSAERATSFYLSSRTGWVIHCFHCCDLRTLCGLVDEEHLQGIQQSSRHYFWKIFCTDRCQYLLVIATSSTALWFFALKVWRSSSWMWSIVCIGGMNVMSKGGVEVCIL